MDDFQTQHINPDYTKDSPSAMHMKQVLQSAFVKNATALVEGAQTSTTAAESALASASSSSSSSSFSPSASAVPRYAPVMGQKDSSFFSEGDIPPVDLTSPIRIECDHHCSRRHGKASRTCSKAKDKSAFCEGEEPVDLTVPIDLHANHHGNHIPLSEQERRTDQIAAALGERVVSSPSTLQPSYFEGLTDEGVMTAQPQLLAAHLAKYGMEASPIEIETSDSLFARSPDTSITTSSGETQDNYSVVSTMDAKDLADRNEAIKQDPIIQSDQSTGMVGSDQIASSLFETSETDSRNDFYNNEMTTNDRMSIISPAISRPAGEKMYSQRPVANTREEMLKNDSMVLNDKSTRFIGSDQASAAFTSLKTQKNMEPKRESTQLATSMRDRGTLVPRQPLPTTLGSSSRIYAEQETSRLSREEALKQDTIVQSDESTKYIGTDQSAHKYFAPNVQHQQQQQPREPLPTTLGSSSRIYAEQETSRISREEALKQDTIVQSDESTKYIAKDQSAHNQESQQRPQADLSNPTKTQIQHPSSMAQISPSEVGQFEFMSDGLEQRGLMHAPCTVTVHRTESEFDPSQLIVDQPIEAKCQVVVESHVQHGQLRLSDFNALATIYAPEHEQMGTLLVPEHQSQASLILPAAEHSANLMIESNNGSATDVTVKLGRVEHECMVTIPEKIIIEPIEVPKHEGSAVVYIGPTEKRAKITLPAHTQPADALIGQTAHVHAITVPEMIIETTADKFETPIRVKIAEHQQMATFFIPEHVTSATVELLEHEQSATVRVSGHNHTARVVVAAHLYDGTVTVPEHQEQATLQIPAYTRKGNLSVEGTQHSATLSTPCYVTSCVVSHEEHVASASVVVPPASHQTEVQLSGFQQPVSIQVPAQEQAARVVVPTIRSVEPAMEQVPQGLLHKRPDSMIGSSAQSFGEQVLTG